MTESPLAPWADREWVLISSSPTRLSVMRQAGIEPIVREPEGDETLHLSRSLEQALQQIALAKLESVETSPEQIALACDTMVLCGDSVMGKPADEQSARRMLELQLEVGHQDILTGVALRIRDRQTSGLARARVGLREGARVDLERLLSGQSWRGIAGGFDYQPDDDRYELQEGTLEDVWGLPVLLIAELLRADESAGS